MSTFVVEYRVGIFTLEVKEVLAPTCMIVADESDNKFHQFRDSLSHRMSLVAAVSVHMSLVADGRDTMPVLMPPNKNSTIYPYRIQVVSVFEENFMGSTRDKFRSIVCRST